ncbi:Ger(x)C family spore germination protein [Pseudogracilibacillus sp. SO30301A]|uniref:Ger(x)C family spore germination protein n=1 Tax=Pseudogracilibacillus sp. SO30301A TaxID=3098291 RepID=UPI00300E16BB
MIKYKSFYFLCLCFILLTGCWDVINIEERGFIIGTAIDIEEDGDEKQPEYIVTNQMVIPAGIANQNQGGVGGEEKAFLNFTSKGKSIYEVNEELSAISSKTPFYEHLAILVISEDVARKEHLFSDLIDIYIRDVDMRRGIKVIVSEADAKQLLDFTTPEDKLPARHIDELLDHSTKEIGVLRSKRVGDIEEYHIREKSFVLPLLHVNEYVDYKAGAVFHGPKDKMVGIFHAEEMQGLEMMKTKAIEKVIEFTYKDYVFALEVNDLNNKLAVDPSNIDEIKVTIDIEIEGIIKESFGKIDLTKPSELKAIQKAVSEQVKDSVEKAIKKGQEELGTDVFNIWQNLETKHYDTWKNIKDDWEKGEYYFKKATFEVNVVTDVFSMGTTNKTD